MNLNLLPTTGELKWLGLDHSLPKWYQCLLLPALHFIHHRNSHLQGYLSPFWKKKKKVYLLLKEQHWSIDQFPFPLNIQTNHRIIGSYSDWCGSGEVSTHSPCPEQAPSTMGSDWVARGFTHPGHETLQAGEDPPSLGPVPTTWLSSWGKGFSRLSLSYFNLCHWFSPSHHSLLWRVWLSLLRPLLWVPRMLLGAPKAAAYPGWTSPGPTASPPRPRAPAQDLLAGCLLNLDTFSAGNPKSDAVPRCNLIGIERRGRSLPSPGSQGHVQLTPPSWTPLGLVAAWPRPAGLCLCWIPLGPCKPLSPTCANPLQDSSSAFEHIHWFCPQDIFGVLYKLDNHVLRVRLRLPDKDGEQNSLHDRPCGTSLATHPQAQHNLFNTTLRPKHLTSFYPPSCSPMQAVKFQLGQKNVVKDRVENLMASRLVGHGQPLVTLCRLFLMCQLMSVEFLHTIEHIHQVFPQWYQYLGMGGWVSKAQIKKTKTFL